jgi:hypothetical protein
MTLIISCVTRDFVVQASDRRVGNYPFDTSTADGLGRMGLALRSHPPRT